jgi:hypothetical protein
VSRRVRLAIVIALVVVVVGGGVTVAAVVTGGQTRCWATLVPAYIPPQAIIELARRPSHPAMLVVNPASGPGAQAQESYVEAVKEGQDAGSRMLGYVSTDYGARPEAEVLADAERYRTWYGVDGIFLDETSHHADDLPHYRAIAEALRRSGLKVVVINPGVVPARGYFDLADVVVTFEGTFAQYGAALERAPAWVADQPAGAIAHLVYAASPADAAAVDALHPHAGYVYVTSGRLPDPWGSTPGYLAAEDGDARACA